MTDKEALELRAKLTEHYGCRVSPVSEYCDALYEYWRAADPYLKEQYPQLQGQMSTLQLVITKSAALVRLLYMGEAVRKEPCPVHKGSWSGMHMSDAKPCDCTSRDGNITGWLPNHPSEIYNPVWIKIESTGSANPSGITAVLGHADTPCWCEEPEWTGGHKPTCPSYKEEAK